MRLAFAAIVVALLPTLVVAGSVDEQRSVLAKVDCIETYQTLYDLADRVFSYDDPILIYEFDNVDASAVRFLSALPWENAPISTEASKAWRKELAETGDLKVAQCDFTDRAAGDANLCQFLFYAPLSWPETGSKLRVGMLGLLDGGCIQ